MAEEYLDADIHGLYILADLVDAYWRAPTLQLAAEIRQQRQCFGLTPIDRRRLQWEVKRVDPERKAKPAQNVPEAPPAQRADDPRKILQFPREATG
jgi:hypothetical protein